MVNNSTSPVNHGRSLLETSSRSVAGSVTATHNFLVTNLSRLDGMGIGKFVSSSTFSLGGRDWSISVFPDGCKKDQDDKAVHVSAFLCFLRGAVDARAKFSLSLWISDDQVTEFSDTHTFHSVNAKWGWSKFIEKSELRELLCSGDDCFTIRCTLTVMEDPRTEDGSNVIVPLPELHQDLTHMLKNGEGPDVTFSVGDQLFPAHKCMLAARSMVFKAQFFGAVKENDTRCVTVHDMEPAIFDALLHFIYTDSLPDDYCSSENYKNVQMQHLLVAADRYGLDRLRLMCEAKLCHNIDVQTVATTLALAEQHHCEQLKDACLGFIVSPGVLPAVMKTDGYKHLVPSCQLVLQEILDKIAAVA